MSRDLFCERHTIIIFLIIKYRKTGPWLNSRVQINDKNFLVRIPGVPNLMLDMAGQLRLIIRTWLLQSPLSLSIPDYQHTPLVAMQLPARALGRAQRCFPGC
uniref:Uncharacterized protein n=1 Tax=Schistocephalus solidus TaxID=70667 RepID=A0A0X3PJI1_SCHSO